MRKTSWRCELQRGLLILKTHHFWSCVYTKFDNTLKIVQNLIHTTRDVVLTNKVWAHIQKIAILKQLPTHFKAKREKGVGT